jgi:hypothetical protein
MSTKEPKIKIFFIRHEFSCAHYKAFSTKCVTLSEHPQLTHIGIRDLQTYRSTVRKRGQS